MEVADRRTAGLSRAAPGKRVDSKVAYAPQTSAGASSDAPGVGNVDVSEGARVVAAIAGAARGVDGAAARHERGDGESRLDDGKQGKLQAAEHGTAVLTKSRQLLIRIAAAQDADVELTTGHLQSAKRGKNSKRHGDIT